MKIIIAILVLTSVAVVTSSMKGNNPIGNVVADSSEMEATWYPE